MPFLLALFLALSPAPALALNFSLSADHYFQALEFYYREPRPEIIEPMLRQFAASRQLANGEKRMFVAAFLSELVKNGSLSPEKLRNIAKAQGRDPRLTIAWTLRLSRPPGWSRMLDEILKPEDAPFRRQIENSPGNLADWNPAWEHSVLGMFFGAFMATGQTAWLGRIIDATAGGGASANMAAASLYEYAPRHPPLVNLLKKRLENATPEQRKKLETILEHARK